MVLWSASTAPHSLTRLTTAAASSSTPPPFTTLVMVCVTILTWSYEFCSKGGHILVPQVCQVCTERCKFVRAKLRESFCPAAASQSRDRPQPRPATPDWCLANSSNKFKPLCIYCNPVPERSEGTEVSKTAVRELSV